MKYSFNADRTKLILTIDEGEKCILKGFENLSSDESMYDFFEPFIANSEFEFVLPSWTNDLTDAPMIGIIDYDESMDIPKVYERWGFMSYQVKSVLMELYNKGEVTFIGGKV